MSVRIFSPAKTSMQSGKGKTGIWIIEFESQASPTIDPLMGCISSGNTLSQLKLRFNSQAEAVAYAQKYGLAYRVEMPKPARSRAASYSDNFKYDRKVPWTH